jgi:hypothetical protein
MIAFIYILFVLSLFIVFPILHILGVILIDIIVIRLQLNMRNQNITI